MGRKSWFPNLEADKLYGNQISCTGVICVKDIEIGAHWVNNGLSLQGIQSSNLVACETSPYRYVDKIGPFQKATFFVWVPLIGGRSHSRKCSVQNKVGNDRNVSKSSACFLIASAENKMSMSTINTWKKQGTVLRCYGHLNRLHPKKSRWNLKITSTSKPHILGFHLIQFSQGVIRFDCFSSEAPCKIASSVSLGGSIPVGG